MNKEVLLALIEKDINELAILNKLFSEQEPVSATILGLAKTKAINIVNGLQQLGDLQPVTAAKLPVVEPVAVVENKVVPEISPEIVAPPQEIIETPKAVQQVSVEPAQVAIAVPVMTPEPVSEEMTVVEKQKVSLAEALNTDNHSLNDTLALATEPSLAKVLSNSRIDDLRQSLSLAERFRFQRELFQGNGEKLSATLSAINGMQSEEDANAYLAQFGWKEDNSCVVDFKQLIHRKFV
jgi:hypothetical protein